jgi:hypothetical protein
MYRNKSRTIFTVLISLIFMIQGLRAQYIEVRADFDTSQIRIGEQLNLDVRVHQPAKFRVEFPDIRDTLVNKVEVLRSLPPDTAVVDGDLEIHRRYLVTSFDSGLYVIPPLKFRFSSDLWTDSIESNPLYLMVHTVPLDSTIYDVKTPINLPLSFLEVFPFVLGWIVVLAAAGFLIWYIRRRKRNKPIFRPARPEDPAHIIAYRELRELKDQKLWQKNEFKEYYSRLTEIIRRYMQRRYGIPAMEMTSYEIMDAWERSGEDQAGLAGELRILLNLADLVTFAKQKPVASENEENMERAFDFVDRTKYVMPVNPGEMEAEPADGGKPGGTGAGTVRIAEKARTDDGARTDDKVQTAGRDRTGEKAQNAETGAERDKTGER